MLRFDNATYLSFFSIFLLLERLSISQWGSELLLFYQFINMVSIFVLNLY